LFKGRKTKNLRSAKKKSKIAKNPKNEMQKIKQKIKPNSNDLANFKTKLPVLLVVTTAFYRKRIQVLNPFHIRDLAHGPCYMQVP